MVKTDQTAPAVDLVPHDPDNHAPRLGDTIQGGEHGRGIKAIPLVMAQIFVRGAGDGQIDLTFGQTAIHTRHRIPREETVRHQGRAVVHFA